MGPARRAVERGRAACGRRSAPTLSTSAEGTGGRWRCVASGCNIQLYRARHGAHLQRNALCQLPGHLRAQPNHQLQAAAGQGEEGRGRVTAGRVQGSKARACPVGAAAHLHAPQPTALQLHRRNACAATHATVHQSQAADHKTKQTSRACAAASPRCPPCRAAGAGRCAAGPSPRAPPEGSPPRLQKGGGGGGGGRGGGCTRVIVTCTLFGTPKCIVLACPGRAIRLSCGICSQLPPARPRPSSGGGSPPWSAAVQAARYSCSRGQMRAARSRLRSASAISSSCDDEA